MITMQPTIDINLKPTTLPLPMVRAQMIGDFLANHGIDASTVETAQRGYLAGWLKSVTVHGLDAQGYVCERYTLDFTKLDGEPMVTVQLADGRSMIEALSPKLAAAVSLGVRTMRQRGLTPHVVFQTYPTLDDATRAHAFATLGLVPADTPGCQPGYVLVEVLRISPGKDRGSTYTHDSARRSRG